MVSLLGVSYIIHEYIAIYPANEELIGGAVAYQLLPEMDAISASPRAEIAVSKTPKKDISEVEVLASGKQPIVTDGTLRRAHTLMRYHLKTRSRCAEIYPGCLTILNSDKEKSITIGAVL
jgi:hypothetical protein